MWYNIRINNRRIVGKKTEICTMDNIIASAATGDNKMVIIIVACVAAAALLFVVSKLGRKK